MAERHKRIFIASITPYFLEKGAVWFEEHNQEITKALSTQAFFQDNLLELEAGQSLNLSELLRRLDEFGYEKVLKADRMGEFSRLGGSVEVFPVNTSRAIRIEFVGNSIDGIEDTGAESKNEGADRAALQKHLKSQKLYSGLKGARPGDYLVHLDHGIGRFQKTEEISGTEYYQLAYGGGDKLFVPKGLERKLSLYVGFTEPRLSRLSSSAWIRTKRRVREEVEKTAKELLAVYAEKEIAQRPPYAPADDIERKLEETFLYEETPDQLQALADIDHDLDQETPMDRLVCGDVGFGKTEIALRAAVRSVKSGYQAALLAPTTILAHQHYLTFQKRLRDLPVTIVLLSRLQSAKEQKHVLGELAEGRADIVIGTHRLLSKDVRFRNLGLLIIDDEQRFGVKQKERLRSMRASLDTLSLSATPIPRTLSMALSSLKDISQLQTPPEGRVSVETVIKPRSEKLVKEAISAELKRGGQVYYLHNRIGTIGTTKEWLEGLVPHANMRVAHGKLKESELISVMDDFTKGAFNVLVSTTIIENGLDIPQVNTIIVEDAARLGLSQAYQIKGRVGRSHKKGYAYFLYGGKMKGKAKLRLRALQEAEELGSGYLLALRDMEIRGAGNILGKEQS
ncbi:MAG: CarD family transcriptional regulator, partial [bacterium]|nr:CarD family transcriptional regulator [bacterium]